ncbi:hypothetical protein MMC14_003962, partial [Varicellaria rhodocarpa]|nr:hypothetical protein [Varicellaria rhodocarpa]
IVFVHGLTGDRENTWTHKETGEFWPRDLLSKDLEKARIMTFGYDANVAKLNDMTSMSTLRDHGKSLLLDLTRLRIRTRTVRYPLQWNRRFTRRCKNLTIGYRTKDR